MRSVSARRGVVLLDAMLAMALIGIGAIATLAMTRERSERIRQLIVRSEEMAQASAFMDAVSLWPRRDLDLRLGARQQGPYTLIVQRPRRTLYELELRDTERDRVLLRTAVFRPEADSAGP
jgi:hypothetical protein